MFACIENKHSTRAQIELGESRRRVHSTPLQEQQHFNAFSYICMYIETLHPRRYGGVAYKIYFVRNPEGNSPSTKPPACAQVAYNTLFAGPTFLVV